MLKNKTENRPYQDVDLERNKIIAVVKMINDIRLLQRLYEIAKRICL